MRKMLLYHHQHHRRRFYSLLVRQPQPQRQPHQPKHAVSANNTIVNRNYSTLHHQGTFLTACTRSQWLRMDQKKKEVAAPFSTSDTTSTSTSRNNNDTDISSNVSKDNDNTSNNLNHNNDNNDDDDDDDEKIVHFPNNDYFNKNPKRVWKSEEQQEQHSSSIGTTKAESSASSKSQHTSIKDMAQQLQQKQQKQNQVWWHQSVDHTDLSSMRDVVDRIGMQEINGGRMRQRKLGVLREDPKEDMRLLIENYTVPALASALRDREDTLQTCATLLAEDKVDEIREILRPYESQYVDERRQTEANLNISHGFNPSNLEEIRKGLNRMPRRVSQAHRHRAGVVLPLCNVNGIPCILFEKRSPRLRAHPDEVCLPGGMVCSANDKSIVATCLREMAEEIDGLDIENVSVLGVLRCNWGEVHHLVGVAVTPVVCFIGDITSADLRPNPDEVAECFTVPLDLFLDSERWVFRQEFAPMFSGGPYPIWGLTGYIMNRFVKDILARFRVQTPDYDADNTPSYLHKFKP